MMKSKRLVTIAAVLLLVVLVLLFLDIRVAWSRTQTNRESGTTSMGQTLPAAMQNRANLAVSVTGDTFLAKPLSSKLLTALGGQYGEPRLLPGVTAKTDSPNLMVRVLEKKMFWTPLYANSQVVVEYAYGSNGSIENVLRKEPVVYNSIDGPTLHSWGKYTLSDTTFGFTTLPGYHSLLAKEITARVGEMLNDLYASK